MAGLWWRSHAELASWLWAVPAGRAGAWVLSSRPPATSVPSLLPDHPLLTSPLHRSGDDPPSAPPGPGGCVRWGWGRLLLRERVGELDRGSRPSLGSQPTPAPRPAASLPPHHPATALPSPVPGPHPCLTRNWWFSTPHLPTKKLAGKAGWGHLMREVGSGRREGVGFPPGTRQG